MSLSNHGQVGLPPAILKHAGGMFHLFIIEGRTDSERSFDTGLRLRSVPPQDERIAITAHPEEPVSLSNHEQAGLPPAILKHAGGMFHLLILEGSAAPPPAPPAP